MRTTAAILLLCVLSGAQEAKPEKDKARKDPAAAALLNQAVAAQGKLKPAEIEDLYVQFIGQVREKNQPSHSITREYWFRAKDKSFRVRTYGNVNQRDSQAESGVFGGRPAVYWEWARERRMPLSISNREHVKNIKSIQKERSDFERILRIVLLARIDTEQTTLKLDQPEKITIDSPNSAGAIFPDRDSAYRVLLLQRRGADPLRLYLHPKDLTVRKVVQLDRHNPTRARFYYYLGAYAKSGELNLPRYISVHNALPTKETREKSTQLSGRLTVKVNRGLEDDIFQPESR
ncbi:MAG: hypothetical protein AAGD14_15060 [Planctomycetota bacterium]